MYLKTIGNANFYEGKQFLVFKGAWLGIGLQKIHVRSVYNNSSSGFVMLSGGVINHDVM